MVIYSRSGALVWSPGPSGALNTHVCVDEDIRFSWEEISSAALRLFFCRPARGLRASGASAWYSSVELRATQVRAGQLCRFRRLYFNTL